MIVLLSLQNSLGHLWCSAVWPHPPFLHHTYNVACTWLPSLSLAPSHMVPFSSSALPLSATHWNPISFRNILPWNLESPIYLGNIIWSYMLNAVTSPKMNQIWILLWRINFNRKSDTLWTVYYKKHVRKGIRAEHRKKYGGNWKEGKIIFTAWESTPRGEPWRISEIWPWGAERDGDSRLKE